MPDSAATKRRMVPGFNASGKSRENRGGAEKNWGIGEAWAKHLPLYRETYRVPYQTRF